MLDHEIQAVFDRLWQDGYGSVATDEVAIMQHHLVRVKPKAFIEIGMASGISAGLIAEIMESCGGESLVTVDYDNSFFGDPSKENGFLIEEIHHPRNVEVRKMPFTMSFDVPALDEQFEMGFVDANHQHPWPTIDTVCLYPVMVGERMLFHHDLSLFRRQDPPIGLGPKYLFDQFPENRRRRFTANGGNLFAIWLNIDKSEFEELAADALSIPWTLRSPLGPAMIKKFRDVLDDHYSSRLRDAFDRAVDLFNPPSNPR